MNINIDINALFSARLAPTSSQVNTKIASGHVQVKTAVIDEQNNLTEVKKVLQNTLRQSTPQAINSLYQSAQDNRVQLYINNEEKEVYEAFTDRVTQHINLGKANGESQQQLDGLLKRISQGAEQAHTETRNILAQLGKLDAGTESYIAESSTYTRFALNELASKISEDEELAEINSNKKVFSLQVTTQQGDQIDITIKQADNRQANTFANKVSVSYEVEGNLSENEKMALSELMNAIGSTSDSLLAGNDLTQLMGIKDFNGQQLSAFSLSLAGSNQEVNYSYQHSDNQQNLSGSWSQKNQVKASFNMQSQLGGIADNEQLARYLTLIENASDASYKQNDNRDESDQTSALFSNTFTNFMQLSEKLGNSLASVNQQFTQTRKIASHLFNETVKNQADRLGLKDEQQATLKEGFNQLADFSASFVANRGGAQNQAKDQLKTGYQIELKQKTNMETSVLNGEITQAIKQKQIANFDSVMQGQLNSRTQQSNEQYEIVAAFDEKQQLNGYKQNRQVREQSKESIYHAMGESRFSEIDKNTVSENNLYLLKEGSLEESKMQGFDNITKGFKAGDFILSQLELHKSYNYQASTFTPNEASFRDNIQSQLSIASQKKLLDEILDKI